MQGRLFPKTSWISLSRMNIRGKSRQPITFNMSRQRHLHKLSILSLYFLLYLLASVISVSSPKVPLCGGLLLLPGFSPHPDIHFFSRTQRSPLKCNISDLFINDEQMALGHIKHLLAPISSCYGIHDLRCILFYGRVKRLTSSSDLWTNSVNQNITVQVLYLCPHHTSSVIPHSPSR